MKKIIYLVMFSLLCVTNVCAATVTETGVKSINREFHNEQKHSKKKTITIDGITISKKKATVFSEIKRLWYNFRGYKTKVLVDEDTLIAYNAVKIDGHWKNVRD